MHKELGAELAVILSSHNLPPDDDGPLRQDRFEDFLRWRQDRLEHELIAVTGVSVR